MKFLKVYPLLRILVKGEVGIYQPVVGGDKNVHMDTIGHMLMNQKKGELNTKVKF